MVLGDINSFSIASEKNTSSIFENSICVRKLPIIGSYNGLLSGKHQVIIWTNLGLLLIGPLGTNLRELLIEIYASSFRKMHLKMSTEK